MCEMINNEHSLGLAKVDMALYDPTRLQRMDEAFSALFYGDYLS